jgi:hypothetical protein
MKITLVSIWATIMLVSTITFAQIAVQPQTGKSLKDLNNQISTAKQSKSIFVKYFEKVNTSQIVTDRMVLGTQILDTDSDGTNKSDSLVNAKIPTWELITFFSFEGGNLSTKPEEFFLTFYVYNRTFPVDSELVLNIDGQEMRFTAVNKGRKLTSDYKVAEGINGKDQNTDDLRSNAGNRSQDAKPFFSTFKLTRAELEKLINSEKHKITLSKQYNVSLRKDYKTTLKTILDLGSL